MPDQNIKRSPEDDFFEGTESYDSKRQELDQAKKSSSSTKPGRKPIETEPKNKRTAQNRAAQRAFRERKERKMKELEDKVLLLEDEKKSMSTESEFLRMQVQMLMSELAKHKGVKDFNDLGLNLNIPNRNVSIISETDGSIASSSTSSLMDSSTGAGNSTQGNTSPESATTNLEQQTPLIPQPFSFDFPWSRKNSSVFGKNSSPLQFNSPTTTTTGNNSSVTNDSYTNSNNNNNNNQSNSNNPGLTSDCSTSSSVDSSPPFDFTNVPDQNNLISFSTKEPISQPPINNLGTDFKFEDHFDEGISDFCAELNSACGTKSYPLPKSQVSTPVSKSNLSTFTGIDVNPTFSVHQELDQHINTLDNTVVPLTNDGNLTFDQSLAFSPAGLRDDSIFGFFDLENQDKQLSGTKEEAEEDVLRGLITEESRYDPFGLFENIPLLNTADSISSGTSKSNTPTSSTNIQKKQYTIPHSVIQDVINTDNEKVPNKEVRLLKCTEIWDRVSSHPRYSDIDIDGLCSELRTKAKCSDKGVVIDYEDVNSVINDSLSKRWASS